MTAAGLVATASVTASAQSSGSSGTTTYTCPSSGGLLLESAVPCDYGTSPPALLNEIALSSGLYAATPAQQASLADFEQQAVANTISDHDLAASDGPAVETYGRYNAEGELWALITQAIETPAASQTPDQQNVVAWLSAVAQRQDVEAADDAGLEYAKWAGLGATNYEDLLATDPSESQLQGFLSGTPLEYGAGDSYDTPSSTSNEGYCDYVSPPNVPNPYTDNIYSPISTSSAGAEPQCLPVPCYSCGAVPYPSYDEFVQWGVADVDDPLFDNTGFAEASRDIGQYVAFGTAGLAAGGIPASVAVSLQVADAVEPFADIAEIASVFGDVGGDAAAAAGAAATLGGAAAVAAAAGPILLVVAGIVAAVVAIIEWTQDAALPGQLASFVYNAPSTAPPDLASMLASSSQASGLYALFVGATLPDPIAEDCDNSKLVESASDPNPAPCWNAPAIPAESSSDPGFLVTEKGSGTSVASRTINWADAALKTDNTAYLAGNWFVDTEAPQSGTGSLTVQELQVQYTDWSGDEELAWLVGNDTEGYRFVTVDETAATSSGQPLNASACVAQGICGYSSTIDYVGTDGKDYSASVVPASLFDQAVDPSASITGPVTALAGTPVSFSAEASSPVGLALSYSWCYEEPYSNSVSISTNGTTQPPSCAFSGTGQDFDVTPDQAGPATVQLKVTDSAGNSTTVSSSVSVDDPTSTSVAVSPASPVAGQTVTYKAEVSPGPDEALDEFSGQGSVSFESASGNVLCAYVGLVRVEFVGGPYTASCTTTYTSAGPEQVTAYYGGGSAYAASSGASALDVGLAPTKTELSVATPAGTPAEPVVSEPFSYIATVELPSQNTAVPTGTVSFTDQAADGSTNTLCTSVALTSNTDGTYSATCPAQASSAGDQPQVTATYSGDAATASSWATTRAEVGKEGVKVSLSASTSAPLVGQVVTYTAELTPVAPATAVDLDGGTVSFSDDQGNNCADVTPGGVPVTATCKLTYSRAGQVDMVARYPGDANTLPGSASTTLEVGAVAPGAPTELTATATDGAVELAWAAPASTGGVAIEGYQVYQGSAPGAEATTPLNANLVATTHYHVGGLSPGGTYYFTVEAVNSSGTSQPSNEAAVTLAAVVPGAPATLTATAGVGTVNLGWAAPTSNGGAPIEGYDIYQATSPTGPTTLVNTSAPLSATAYTVGGLSAGQAYYFSVEAVNAVGRGPASAVASATPLAPLSTGNLSVTTPTTTGTPGTTTTTGTTGTTTGTGTPGTTTTTGTPGTTGTTTGTGTGTTTTTTTTTGTPATATTTGTTTASTTGTTTATTTGTTTATTTTGTGQAGGPHLVATATTLWASGPARFGQPSTFTAKVAALNGGDAPSGTVSFSVDGTSLGAPVSLADGTASATAAGLSPGPHQVTASYSGDGGFAASSATMALNVGCSRTVTEAHTGALRASGATCVIGTTVNGPIEVARGATLGLFGATVTGPVTADGPASAMVCASVLSGPLTISGATGPVEVGGPAGSLCGADKVSGHLAVLGARGPVHIAGASVAGPILLMGDTGGLAVDGATSAGDLAAVGNTGRVSLDGDTVEGALVASWGSGTLDIRSDRVGGGAEVSFNSARSAPTVSANALGAGLGCEANTPAPADYGAANHVRGKATGQCANLG